MKQWVLAMAVVLLGACSSPVRLDKVPVEDKSGSAVTATDTSGADSGAVGAGKVATLDLGKSRNDSAMDSTTRVIYFDYDSYTIRPEFQPVIEAHAKYLRANATRKVVLEGHTDERGGREYNLALGQKRSEAVRKALVLLGVPESQLEAVSFGKEKPVALGSDEESMAKNRRAEISYR